MKLNYIKREIYLRKIRPFYKTDIIKVITGIRRCGKSVILKLIVDELRSTNVLDKDIIYIDLDDYKNKDIDSVKKLEEKINSYLVDDDFKYLFIDEIQNVSGYEQLINAYNNDGRFSIFITGSNSYLLSGELATKLTGRYIEFEIFTLNFQEYLQLKKVNNLKIGEDILQEFNDYISYGGFPKTLEFDNIDAKQRYSLAIVNEIFEKDIKKRNKINNKLVFEKLEKYIINNFAATISIDNIYEYFRKIEKINIKQETIYRYLKILEEAKIIYECKRFDCRSKKSLRGEQKFYLAD